MFTYRVALWAMAAAIAVSTSVHGDEPSRRWRPATAADLPVGTPIVAAGAAPAPSASGVMPASIPGVAPVPSSGSDAQRVHIDPATGAIVPMPAAAAATESSGPPAAPMTLRRSAKGFLYVDTSSYLHTATATLDADGKPHVDCDDPQHAHAPAAISPEPQP
jgi:hypothetical protein